MTGSPKETYFYGNPQIGGVRISHTEPSIAQEVMDITGSLADLCCLDTSDLTSFSMALSAPPGNEYDGELCWDTAKGIKFEGTVR